MPCLSYTVHLTPRMKTIFFIFVRDEIPYFCKQSCWALSRVSTADLDAKARCKFAYGSALISRGPRCMQACSGELRSAIRSVIEQCTASHVSIVASKRRVGHILSYLMEQYFLCFFLYLPKGIYLCCIFKLFLLSLQSIWHLSMEQGRVYGGDCTP